MEDRLLVLLDEANYEVNEYLKDFLRGLSNKSLLDFIPVAIISVLIKSLVLHSDLISFVHDDKKVCKVKVVCLV